jgi:hypothetical protein
VSWNTGTGTTAQPASRALASSTAIFALFMSESCFYAMWPASLPALMVVESGEDLGPISA